MLYCLLDFYAVRVARVSLGERRMLSVRTRGERGDSTVPTLNTQNLLVKIIVENQ